MPAVAERWPMLSCPQPGPTMPDTAFFRPELFESTFVLWVRRLTIHGHFSTRDPVSGTVFFLLLGAFAVIPVFVRPRGPRTKQLYDWQT